MPFSNRARDSEAETVETPSSVDMTAALSAVERLTRLYPTTARKTLAEIGERVAGLDAENADAVLHDLRRFAHNFSGQGASFNYPLISEIADSLRAVLHACADGAALRRPLLEAHFGAMQAVLDRELSGDGGDEGCALMSSLKEQVSGG